MAQLRLSLVPRYLFICNEENQISPKETVDSIYEMIKIIISKVAFNEFSIKRAKCMQGIIDLVALYTPSNEKLWQTLATSVMYYGAKNVKKFKEYGIEKNKLKSKEQIAAYENLKTAKELMLRARTKLIQFWEKQNWMGTVRLYPSFLRAESAFCVACLGFSVP